MRRLTFLTIFLCPLLYALCLPTVWATDIKIKSTSKGGYELLVNGEPFLVKGVVYHPIPPGNDHAYNFWLDLDEIDRDAKIMKKAGFNVVRFYTPSEDLEQTKKVVRKLHENGIYTVVGHWLGFWNYPCPFYGDKEFEARVKKEVLDMVEALKDEEGILMWILGNENNP
jgi:beta-galactosidase/beta-glucuronidase